MSQAAEEKLVNLLETLKGLQRIALYSSFRNEVEAGLVFQEAQKLGMSVVFPKVEGEGLRFLEVPDLSEMEEGRLGIIEPSGSKGQREWALDEIDLIVVPGIAFDGEGYRIGFGKGYYDRTLANFRGWKVGLAYDFQILRKIPHGEEDIQCDWVVTDKRVVGRRL